MCCRAQAPPQLQGKTLEKKGEGSKILRAQHRVGKGESCAEAEGWLPLGKEKELQTLKIIAVARQRGSAQPPGAPEEQWELREGEGLR